MRRLIWIVIAVAASAGVLAAGPAAAGSIVDPSTLQPPPPNAVCREDGRQVICDTFFVEEVVNEPITALLGWNTCI
jgi:hypothetical protein